MAVITLCPSCSLNLLDVLNMSCILPDKKMIRSEDKSHPLFQVYGLPKNVTGKVHAPFSDVLNFFIRHSFQ